MRSQAERKNPDDLYDAFTTIALSTLERLGEQTEADIGFISLRVAHERSRTPPMAECSSKCQVLDAHGDMKDSTLEALEAMYARNTIVWAHSVLDGFVTDLTRFLVLLHPDRLSGKEVKVSTILSLSDYAGILNHLVDRHVHEVGYRSLEARLQYLRDEFGVDLSRMEKLIARVCKLTRQRHDLIHNGSLFHYGSGSSKGIVEAVERKDLSELSWEASTRALLDCILLTKALFERTSQVLFRGTPRGIQKRVWVNAVTAANKRLTIVRGIRSIRGLRSELQRRAAKE